jgi:hypothetical protein
VPGHLSTACVSLALCLALASCGDEPEKQTATSVSTTTTASTAPTSSTTTTTPQELSEESRLRLDGIGPVRVGMSIQEASRAIDRDVAVDPDSLFDEDSLCGFAEVKGGPADLLFMVTRATTTGPWIIARVDVVEASRIVTGAGIRIGAGEDEVKKAYGAPLKVEAHQYQEAGHYLVLDVDGAGGLMLLFETDGAKVTQFRSGTEGAVRAPEGCA